MGHPFRSVAARRTVGAWSRSGDGQYETPSRGTRGRPHCGTRAVSRADRFDSTVDVVRPDTATDSMDTVEMLSLIWERRAFLSKVAVRALIVSTLIAFLLPTKYDSTVRLMPPDSLGDSGMILAALAAGSGSGVWKRVGVKWVGLARRERSGHEEQRRPVRRSPS